MGRLYDSLNFLVVDDDEHSLNNIVLSLEDKGCTIFESLSAEKAIEILGYQDIDVAIVDLKLPGADGISVLEHIKNNSPKTLFIWLYSKIG